MRLYRPESSEAARPVVVFAHGGGFVFCDLDSHDEFCRSMAEAVGAVVVSVDYRLAPEHPAPAAHDDLYAALEWTAATVASYGGDPARIVLAGDSAGGNLAVTVAIPTRAESLAGLPSAVVATAELDPPCSSGDDYADRLAAAGVSVQHRRFDGLFHGFLTFPALSLSEPARQEVWKMVRALVDGPDLPVTGTSGFAS